MLLKDADSCVLEVVQQISPVDQVPIDDYQPAERKFEVFRRMRDVCLDLGFPVAVLERSPLVLRVLDLLQAVNQKAVAAVIFSIISTADTPGYERVRQMENLSLWMEKRFAAIELITRAGILTGTCLMPVLPSLCDDDANLEERDDHATPTWVSPSLHRPDRLARVALEPGLLRQNWGFSVLGGRKHDAFRRRVIELAELCGDEDILDAGCCTGLTTLRIAEQYPKCRVHGIDLSIKMIEVARNDAAERGLDVDLRTGSITDLPYPDVAFDVVLTNIMFHHLGLVEKRLAVAEITRVLRPGGHYVSAEFGPRARNMLERRLPKGEYTLYPSHLAEAGLAVQREELSPFVWAL